MLNRVRILFFISIICGLCSCNQEQVRKIPISDFFKNAETSFFRLSPDGKYISYLKPYKGRQNLFIKSLIDGKEHMATSFTDYSVREFFWTYNDQIALTQDIISVDEFKMFALDVPTLKIREILSLNKGRIFILNNPDTQEPDVVTIRMNKRDPANFDIYKINIKTGELKPYLINPGNITEWFPGDDGKIRLVKASDGVDETILYRVNDNAPFKPIIKNNFKNRVQPIAFTGADNNNFYALSNVNQDKIALVEIAAVTGKEKNVIFSCDKADIDRVDYSRNKHRLELAICNEAKPKKHFLNADIERIYNSLSRQLKGSEIIIVGRDSAEDKFIIKSYTDRNPGTYYLYERGGEKLTRLGDINTSINPDELCAMQPIAFKARDGVLINGYLTLPMGTKTTDLPVVVMPHDGPWKRDTWGYSDEVQFLANRGYAVFQVNYRGSTGYGKAFFSAGFKQAGGKIQNDITDGVNWLINKKIANPNKIAIFGGGFGGFSALYGVSFHPGLYNCAIVQYGLINFFTYIKDVPPYMKPRLQMMYEMIGNPESDAERLRAISPVFHTDKIKAPVLIFQGAKDETANISELNQFVRELKKQNVQVAYYLKQNERKTFRNEHNRMEMYSEIEKFLDNNMRVKP
jgi:dipeptidyl aminopeptidase/acylaminoacyl peptidase